MILLSKPSFEFVSVRENSWSISPQCPATPSLPILPSLPLVLLSLVLFCLFPISCKFVSIRGSFFVSSCLGGYASIMQNKANFKIGKMALTPCHEKHYSDFPPRSARKNKPNQTQLTPRNTLHATRYMPSAIRNTPDDIRPTKYEIRTLHNRRRAAII